MRGRRQPVAIARAFRRCRERRRSRSTACALVNDAIALDYGDGRAGRVDHLELGFRDALDLVERAYRRLGGNDRE